MKTQKFGNRYVFSALALVLLIGGVMATAPMVDPSELKIVPRIYKLTDSELDISDSNPNPGDGDFHLGNDGVIPEVDSNHYRVLFDGSGYLLSVPADRAYSIDLRVISEARSSDISGTFEIMGIDLDIEGRVLGGSGSPGHRGYFVEFDVFSTNGDEPLGEFEGFINDYGAFTFVEGTFQGNLGNEWKLLAYSN